MKEFFRLLRRFVPPYKKYLIWALFLNLLSAILNIFSFALIIPIPVSYTHLTLPTIA